MLAFLPGAAAAGGHQQPEARGLFGTITEVRENHPGAGETSITLDTESGPAEFTAEAATRVRIPGFDSASAANLRTGNPVAVLLSGERAVSILAPTELPVRTRHFTGVVTSVGEDGSIGLRSREGEQITAPALGDLQEIRSGELVTAVIEHDPATGSLAITALDRGSASLERIASALELAQRSNASSNIDALQQRLLGNSTHHLSALQELSQKTGPVLGPRISNELEDARQAYASVLSQAGAGKPRGEVTGILTSVGGPGRRIIVAPQGLHEVEVVITDRTSLWGPPAGLPGDLVENWFREESDTPTYVRRFGGRGIRFDQLEMANRVRVWYELETAFATRVQVLPGASLAGGPADALLSLAIRGEAKGTVTGVSLDSTPPAVIIQDEVSDGEVRLSVAPDSIIAGDTGPVQLSSLPGAVAAASYGPESRAIIELDLLTPVDSEATVHGVVHSFVPKVLPGNFLVLTVEGEIRAFSHTEDTVIKKDGRRVSINEVRLGDLVRPATNYRAASGEGASGLGSRPDLVAVSLRSPPAAPVRGTIRGIADRPGLGTAITLSDNWLELVTLVVTDHTQLSMPGGSVGIPGLAVGQRVLAGFYDPLSSEAVSLVIVGPRSVPIKGEITAIDENLSSITVTPGSGVPVDLFVLESTPARIILEGVPGHSLGDLRVGQQVRIGYYDPNSLEALRLVIN